MELVDLTDLESVALARVGSNPTFGTNMGSYSSGLRGLVANQLGVNMACRSSNLLLSLGYPNNILVRVESFKQ